MTNLTTRFATLFLATTLAISSVASASPAFTAVAEMFSRYSARFFLTQTTHGQTFARSVLGHRIRTNRDFQRFILGYDSSRLTAAERSELLRHIDDLERTADAAATRQGANRFGGSYGDDLRFAFNRTAAEKLHYRLSNTDPRRPTFVPAEIPEGFLASRDRFLHSTPGVNPVRDAEAVRLASEIARNGSEISLGRANLYPNRGLPTRNQAYRGYVSRSGHQLGDVTVDVTLRNAARTGESVQPRWEIDPVVGLRSDTYFGANRSLELELHRTSRQFEAGLGGVESETYVYRGVFDEVTGVYPVEITAEITGRRTLIAGQTHVDFGSAPVVKVSVRPLLPR